MRKEINWEKQAKRDFDPVQLWNDAMNKVATRVKVFVEPEEPALNSRKQTDVLMAKNPNHFRDAA